MITLITGIPGAGKTLNTLKLVDKECAGRQVYYRGINELTLPWTELTDDEVKKWYDLPDGSVIVIDEVQQIWPNHPANKPSPLSVNKLDTHRHRGFDFYIITQRPTMLDFNARGFVGRHYHYDRAFGRDSTRQFEWQKAINDPSDYHAKSEAQVTRVSFPKEYYDKYKSAEIHTGKKRIPKAAYLFGFLVLGFIALAVYFYDSMSTRLDDSKQVEIQTSTVDQLASNTNTQIGRFSESLPELTYIEKLEPRIQDVPWSAPIYDEVTEVKTFPRPQCIYRFKNRQCKCYTQQATPLEISNEQCLNYVQNGYFNPFKDEADREGGRQGLPPAPPEYTFRQKSTPKPVEPPPQVIYFGG